MTLLPVLLLSGCRTADSGNEESSAAATVYRHYADRTEFTVACLVGYESCGIPYNLVMFKPVDSAGWEELDEEFNVTLKGSPRKKAESDMACGVKDFVNQSIPQITLDSGTPPDSSVQSWADYDYRPGELVLRTAAAENGVHYYLKLVDLTNHTLWVLFFDTEEQFQALFEHHVLKNKVKRSRELTLQISYWQPDEVE